MNTWHRIFLAAVRSQRLPDRQSVLPLRDDIGDTGASPTALLIFATILVLGLILPGGDVAVALICAWAAWVFVPTPVRELGFVLVVASALAGGGIAWALASNANGATGAWATIGATASIVLLHLIKHPRALIYGLVPLPYRAGLADLPSKIIAAGWVALASLLAILA